MNDGHRSASPLGIFPPESQSKRQAWYGTVYMAAIAAQAGRLWTPTPGEGDIHSLDGTVTVRPGGFVSVQVKCQSRMFKRSRSYPIQSAWRRNWVNLQLPAYFVVVVVPRNVSAWIDHDLGSGSARTIHNTHAYWSRIDPLPPEKKSIQVTAADRLTVDTIDSWAADYEAAIAGGFRGGAE